MGDADPITGEGGRSGKVSQGEQPHSPAAGGALVKDGVKLANLDNPEPKQKKEDQPSC